MLFKFLYYLTSLSNNSLKLFVALLSKFNDTIIQINYIYMCVLCALYSTQGTQPS